MTDYTIRWSPTARRTYFQTIDYLVEKWTEKEAEAFILRVEKVLGYIQENPYLYPYSRTGNTFKCVVVKQVSLFYRLRNEQVELLVFWDNRQDPSKLKL